MIGLRACLGVSKVELDIRCTPQLALVRERRMKVACVYEHARASVPVKRGWRLGFKPQLPSTGQRPATSSFPSHRLAATTGPPQCTCKYHPHDSKLCNRATTDSLRHCISVASLNTPREKNKLHKRRPHPASTSANVPVLDAACAARCSKAACHLLHCCSGSESCTRVCRGDHELARL